MEELDFDFGDGTADEDFCRGYGLGSAEGLEDPYFEARQAQENEFNLGDDNVVAPEMPQNFYENVESFLTRPPPTIKDTVKSTKIKSKGGGAPSKGVTLPDIHAKCSGGNISLPQPPQVPSKVRSKLLSNANKPISKPFDHNLLREAFAYTDMLLKEAIIEEANSGPIGGEIGMAPGGAAARGKEKKGGSGTTRTAPVESVYLGPHPDSAPAALGKGAKAGDQTRRQAGAKGVVKKLRAKVPSEAHLASEVFHVNTEAGADASRRNPINYDELISNFENGVTLQRLRKELEDSKHSMKQSENMMRQLSMEYLSSGKGKGRGGK